jgi:hypothetical protein
MPLAAGLLTACLKRTEGLTFVWGADPRVSTATDAVSTGVGTFKTLEAGPDGFATVVVSADVVVEACVARLDEPPGPFHEDTLMSGGDLPRHSDCDNEPDRLDPEDIESLTVTATLIFELQEVVSFSRNAGVGPGELLQGVGPDGLFRDASVRIMPEFTQGFPIGPLRFGERASGIGNVEFRLPLPPQNEADPQTADALHEGYRVVARILDCRLSNGSACGSNTGYNSYEVIPPGGIAANATATAATGTSSSGLTGSSPTPAQPSSPGSSNTGVTRGTFTGLSPNPNGMTLGSVNSVSLTVAGDGTVSGTFELSYYFGQNSQGQFRFAGRLEGERSGDHVTGTVALGQPGADALAAQFEFGGNRATWEADITATGVSGVVHLLDGGEIAFETRGTPAL